MCMYSRNRQGQSKKVSLTVRQLYLIELQPRQERGSLPVHPSQLMFLLKDAAQSCRMRVLPVQQTVNVFFRTVSVYKHRHIIEDLKVRVIPEAALFRSRGARRAKREYAQCYVHVSFLLIRDAPAAFSIFPYL